MELSLPISDSNLESRMTQLLTDSSPMALFTAVCVEDITYLQSAIERMNINSKNREGRTPLMNAACYGKADVVTLLLSNKADVHAIDAKGRNALMVAARNGFASVVRKLIQAGSIIESRDHDDWTPLFHGIYSENVDVVNLLLMFGANPNTCLIASSKTPLLMAVTFRLPDIVELLLKAGANPNITSVSGQTALQVATQFNYIDIVDILTESVAETGSFNDLENILNSVGLSSYMQLFKDGAVDLPIFLSLTEEELKNCGVTKLGPRKKLMEAIRRWHSNGPITTGEEGCYANRLNVQISELKESYQEKCKEMQTILEENELLRSALLILNNKSIGLKHQT